MALKQRSGPTFSKARPDAIEPVADVADERMSALEKAGHEGQKGTVVPFNEPEILSPLRTQTPQGKFQSIQDCVEVIAPLWNAAQRNFVNIGRYLNRAREELPHGQFELMIENDLPFGRSTCHALREIAAAIDSNKFGENELPCDYSAAYSVVTLPDAALEKARAEGLVSPTTKRKEISAFRKGLKLQESETKTAPVDVKSLDKAKVRLTTQLAKIEKQKSELERDEAQFRAELAEVEKKLMDAKLAAEAAQRQALAILSGGQRE